MATSAEIQTKVLTRGKSPEQYRLYRAALEWDLSEPIVIQNADDLRSRQRWRDRVTPFHHQVTNLITFCRRLPVTLLADDVGLGKTISAGLIMSELIERARLSKVLTGRVVRSGVLEACQKTGKRVIPSELSDCMVTGTRALKSLYETSSVSNRRLLKEVAIQSKSGRFCAPVETQVCEWSGQKHHPDDMRVCALTAASISWEFSPAEGVACLRPLRELLDGVRRTEDARTVWDNASDRLAAHHGGKTRVESAVKSLDGNYLALCCESKTLFGLRSAQLGALYDLRDGTIFGKIAVGKRDNNSWIAKR